MEALPDLLKPLAALALADYWTFIREHNETKAYYPMCEMYHTTR